MRTEKGRSYTQGFREASHRKARVYPLTYDFFQRRVRRWAVLRRLRIASCVRGNAANDEVVVDDADSSASARRLCVGLPIGRRRIGGWRRARLVFVRYEELDTASCLQSSPSMDDPVSIASDAGSGTYSFVVFRSTRLALRERCSGVSRCNGR